MRITLIVVGHLLGTASALAQHSDAKKDTVTKIQEVKIHAKGHQQLKNDIKMNISIDEYLSSSANISFIKRGAYAWEPLLNNMSSERSVITIDGMHIFGACTDKMDPVTSYLESNNLSGIAISSGQEGNMHGATVAGSIDLQKKKTPFAMEKSWNASYQTGFEFNNQQYYNLANIAHSTQRWVTDASIAFRKSANYTDGNNQEIKHSQYQKFNTSLGLAYKTSDLSSIRIDAIFDQANDVGYPALPMDLWLSRALITSATYKQLFENDLWKAWETKVYFNAVEHYMDDTKRPENLVHMDMPGWSNTQGILSKLSLVKNQWTSEIQWNAYKNVSIAEMTMYPQDRSQKTMFAYTWPWVTTAFSSLAMNNVWSFSELSRLNFSGSLGWNYNHSKYSEFNKIFYPDASQSKNRILPSLHVSFEKEINNYYFNLGMGFGQRAPSISEAYGYYIYNSFDRYDYVGNPDLANETSLEWKASAGYKTDRFSMEAKANYFYIQDYIVGRILNLGSPMNYQSVGVKGYHSLDYAQLFNISLEGQYDLLTHLHWKGSMTYAKAVDFNKENLPFIRPLNYQSSLHLMHNQWSLQLAVQGDLKHRDFSPMYGEDQTPAFQIWNMSTDYHFQLKKYHFSLQVGVENLFNRFYTTYADWGNIPRMGRNVFSSLKLAI